MTPPGVAVIGAGPAGIVTARYLASQGLEPVLFEQSDRPGGQWNIDNPLGGIWPGMRTNTSRELTRFGDLAYSDDIEVFPTAEQVHRYLCDYLDAYGLTSKLRLGHELVELDQGPDGRWDLALRRSDGSRLDRSFDRVVIATGRFNQPWAPAIEGLTPGQGALRSRDKTVVPPCIHSAQYKRVGSVQGLRVLVAGGAISALEIASDLVHRGASRVTLAARRQRYVIRKLHEGVPTDHLNFSLSEAHAGELLEPDELARELKAFILDTAGNPADHGAPEPHEDVRRASYTKCEHFLDHVAAGAIERRPWIEKAVGSTVQFVDGSSASYDLVILATGYALDLPFLGDELKSQLSIDAEHIALYKHSFHPGLPGLAIVGFYNQVGPYFPVLELQARWVAYQLSGLCQPIEQQQMRQGLRDYYEHWGDPQKWPMHQLALLFARETGTLPDPRDWPSIRRALLFGPLSPHVFRLVGPDALPEAPDYIQASARAFGPVRDETLTEPETRRILQLGLTEISDKR